MNDLKSIDREKLPNFWFYIPQDQTLGFVAGFFHTVKPILKASSHGVICGNNL